VLVTIVRRHRISLDAGLVGLRRDIRPAVAVAIACVLVAGCDDAPKTIAASHPVATDAQGTPRTASTTREPAISPFRLVGTVIDARDRFAMLRGRDGARRIVRPDDQIDGYTIGAIESDRIHVSSPRDGDQVVIASAEVEAVATNDAPPPLPVGALIKNVNLDQSIPRDVHWGPTAAGPDGNTHFGH
jgi:hypothetical protein